MSVLREWTFDLDRRPSAMHSLIRRGDYWACEDCRAVFPDQESSRRLRCTVTRAATDPVYTGNNLPMFAQMGDTWLLEDGRVLYATFRDPDRPDNGWWIDPDRPEESGYSVQRMEGEHPETTRLTFVSVQPTLTKKRNTWEWEEAYEQVWRQWGVLALYEWVATEAEERLVVLDDPEMEVVGMEKSNDGSMVMVHVMFTARVRERWAR